MEKERMIGRIQAFKELKFRKLCCEVERMQSFTEVQIRWYESSQEGYPHSTREIKKGFLDNMWDLGCT